MTDSVNLRSVFLTHYFPGIGKATVDRMFSNFTAEDLLSQIASKQITALNACGIKNKLVLALQLGYTTVRPLIQVALYLDAHGVSKPIAATVLKAWGPKCLEKIMSNPYRLIDLASWAEVDPIGLQRGPKFHPCRLVAAIKNCMYTDYEDGKNTCIDQEALKDMVKHLIGCSDENFNHGLKLAIDTGMVVKYKDYLQVPAAHMFERRIEKFLFNNAPTRASEVMVKHHLANPKYKTLTEEQRTAASQALLNSISAYHGRGGSGKTFTLSVIADGAENILKKNVILSAVAAKACRKISKETGRSAKTIASLLYSRDPKELQNSIIIVDEASMLSLIDMYQLVRMLPTEAHLVLLGDPYQIPSIDAGRVFYDIIRNKAVPLCELTINKRQDSKTDTQLKNILSGEFPILADYNPRLEYGIFKQKVRDVEAAENRAVKLYLELAQRGEEVQIISPLKQFIGGSDAINRKVHIALFHRTDLCEHTPVIWTKNIRTKSGIKLTNGSMGFVKGPGTRGYYIEIAFEHEGDVQLAWDEATNHLEMSYCLTVHKAQGSEWDNVIIVLPNSDRLVDRNMVYTAFSRCKKRSIIVYHDHRFIKQKVQAEPAHERRRSLFLSGGL